MKSHFTILLAGLISLTCLSCERVTKFPLPLGTYFTFGDQARIARLQAHDFIAERVDLADSTNVLESVRISSFTFAHFYDSRRYTLLFELSGGARPFYPDQNNVYRVRFRYEGLPGVVDKLEFKTVSGSPANVMFNGKSIPSQGSDEPVESSFLYVLQ